MATATEQEKLDEALCQAALEHRWQDVSALAQQGANPDSQIPMNDYYVLHYACRNPSAASLEAAKTLLQCGANPNLKCTENDLTAAHVAVATTSGEHVEFGDRLRARFVKTLAAYDAWLDETNKGGDTPLTIAGASGSRAHCTRTLIGLGADVGRPSVYFDDFGDPETKRKTPIEAVARTGTSEGLSMLALAGADLGGKPTGPNEQPSDIILRRQHGNLGAIMNYFINPKTRERLDACEQFDKDILLNGRDGDHALILHPATWQYGARIFRDLEANGEHLTKKEVLEHHTLTAEWSILGMAVASGNLKPLLAHLARHGERLEMDDLLFPLHEGELEEMSDEERKKTILSPSGKLTKEELISIYDYSELPTLLKHWQETSKGLSDILDQVNELPESLRDDLPLHQMTAAMRRADSIGHGGGGRLR